MHDRLAQVSTWINCNLRVMYALIRQKATLLSSSDAMYTSRCAPNVSTVPGGIKHDLLYILALHHF